MAQTKINKLNDRSFYFNTDLFIETDVLEALIFFIFKLESEHCKILQTDSKNLIYAWPFT